MQDNLYYLQVAWKELNARGIHFTSGYILARSNTYSNSYTRLRNITVPNITKFWYFDKTNFPKNSVDNIYSIEEVLPDIRSKISL